MKTEPELTLEWCDEIWRHVPPEARKSVAESVKWVIEQDRARLQSSPAPVAGGVPEFDRTLNESHLTKWLKIERRWEAYVDGFHECLRRHDEWVSRLPAIKPGEVVVAIPDPTGIVVDLPERYRERGIELVRNAIQWAREHARIVPRAQATTSGEVGIDG